MIEEIKIGHNLFGYDTFVKDGNKIITLKGACITELDIGMEVVLLGDSMGYVPSDFSPGQKVMITEFAEPFVHGQSDHIIQVSSGSWTGWVKPSNIQTVKYHSDMRCRADANLRRMKGKAGKGMGDFMSFVYLSMSDVQRAELPSDITLYVNAIVSYALERVADFGDNLAQTIASVYGADIYTRFIQDPIRTNENTNACLYLDNEGYLISVLNPQIAMSSSTPGCNYIKDYDYYVVLNGPAKGKKVISSSIQLREPVYKTIVELGPDSSDAKMEATKQQEKKGIKIFISYARKDEKLKDELLEHLSGLKQSNVISTWTDRQILGGDEWDQRINQHLEEAQIILFLVSASFMNSNYINEVEIKRSIEKHVKGEAIVVPIIIRFCDFQSLPLGKYQALPKNAQPIENWKPRNKGWLDVINQLKNIISKLN